MSDKDPFDFFDTPSAPAVGGTVLSQAYGVSGSGDPEAIYVSACMVQDDPWPEYEYRWASMAYRTDSPSVAELEADGWVTEHVDPRYGTHLMMRRHVNAGTTRDCPSVPTTSVCRGVVLRHPVRVDHPLRPIALEGKDLMTLLAVFLGLLAIVYAVVPRGMMHPW